MGAGEGMCWSRTACGNLKDRSSVLLFTLRTSAVTGMSLYLPTAFPNPVIDLNSPFAMVGEINPTLLP